MPVRKGIVQAADGVADPLLARVPGLDPVEGRPLTPDERTALKDLFSLRVLSGPTPPP